MKFVNVLSELWLKPMLITPYMHRLLCEIVQDHITGLAHADGGRAAEWAKIGDAKAADRDEAKIEMVDGVAVIPVRGIISQGLGIVEDSSGIADVFDVSRMIDLATSDRDVSAIVYDIDSPGGSVTGTPEIAAKIRAAAAVVPSVAYTSGLMASAAYWIGSQADAIYAAQSALVGSIGVYMAWLDSSRAMEMAGLKTELIKHGKFKAIGLDGTALNDEQRAMLQSRVDRVFEWFAGAVREQRDVDPAAMEGQTYYGDDAIAVGLVDAVGSRDDAIAEARQLAEMRKGGK